ncbi:MAG: GntR family transcriptional regulator [Hyphomonadaceae bacterium]|jgi:GntR family transcriptional regulator|nr:GntR family transcriptional regulator [Hyphomonadaceae bacterium]
MSKFSIRPLYLQVRDALAERIASGEWKPNTTVPNETDLARELGVSPGTMRKALDLLESDGLVTRRQGRGTFVNDPASPELATRYNKLYGANGEHIIGEIETLAIVERPANAAERGRLRLDTQDLVYRITRVRSHAGKVYLTEEASLPAALFPRLAETDLRAHGIVAIAHAYGVLLGEAVERVSLGAASAQTAKMLNIVEQQPILILDRIIKTRDGRIAEWRMAGCTMGEMHYKVETT